MHNSLHELSVKPDFILVDGSDFQIFTENGEIVPHRCVVKGDNLYASIAVHQYWQKYQEINILKKCVTNIHY